MRTRFRTVAAGVAATALVATSIMGSSSASAEVFPIDDARLTGSLEVAGNPAVLPVGGSASGTWDEESGDLDLQFTVPEGSLVVQIGDGVDVVYQLTNLGGVSGNIDDFGDGTASGTFQLNLKSVSLLGGDVAPCSFEPIEMEFTIMSPDTGVLELSEAGFTIPPTDDSCNGNAATINSILASEGNTAVLVVELSEQAEEPEPTIPAPHTTEPTTTEPATTPPATTPPATTPPAAGPAAGAQPVAGAANYTG